MAQADLTQPTVTKNTKNATRRKRSEIDREMKVLSAVALVFLIPGFIAVFMMPPLGVIFMTVGGFIWLQKDSHYANELQRNRYTPDESQVL
jgi:hypothetical protein